MDETVQKIIDLLKSNKSDAEIKEELDKYHESDIADAISELDDAEKNHLFKILGKEDLSDVLPYVDDVDEVMENIPHEKAADIIELMDSDDAVDVLQELDDEDQEKILDLMDKEAAEDAKMILSYDDDEIGSKMTTNYVTINKGDSVKAAMKKVIEQAAENDNITTIFVINKKGNLFGTLDLKDLIRARDGTDLESLVVTNFPTLQAHQKVDDVINELKEYGESIIPVLNENNILIGVITSNDIIEAVDEALGEDYSKLAGLTSEEDIHESIFQSMKKRIPWLILLLFLGILVSFLISSFNVVIATLPALVFFQSMVLDMAGNAGTQSLAVTIRVLTDENVKGKDLFKLIFKEIRVGFCNGLVLGVFAFVAVYLYLFLTKQTIAVASTFSIRDCLVAAAIVGTALLSAMILSSFVGTVVPIIFKKIKIDPAVASGPLITTVNDMVAICCYYGLAMILFENYLL